MWQVKYLRSDLTRRKNSGMENQDRRLSHQLQGARAKAAGKFFEDLIESRLDALEQDGIVRHWQHNEPLFRCLGKRFMPVGAGVADYSGMFSGGLYFAIEAKSTKEARLPLDRISTKQLLHLDDTAGGGGLAFLAIQHREPGAVRDFLIPWAQVPWVVARTAKSVRVEDLDEWEAPRCVPALYMDPFVWRCPVCSTVQKKPCAQRCCTIQ